MRLVIIGMMGSGKSTVGRQLAREIGFPFIDTDHMIEAQTGKWIHQIFAEEGEDAFRRYESDVVDQLSTLDHVVIACGGGTLSNPTNREKLRANSIWIYLKATPETLWKRLSGSSQPLEKRPLLTVPDPMNRLASLLAEREPIYRQADLIIPTGDQPVQHVVREIMKRLPESLLRQPEASGEDRDDSAAVRHAAAKEDLQEITVHLGVRSYPIWIGQNVLQQAGDLTARVLPCPEVGRRQAVIIGQPAPKRLYAEPLAASLQQAGYETQILEIPDGETAKSLATASDLYDRLVELKADRSTILFALGGGVAGDLTGYVAATYMRGLPFVQVPTSLLAQVDASIGGKVAVNHPAGKNLIGAYYQPKAVLIDTRTLSSLPDDEFRNGMAEVIKYALLSGESDVSQLELHREVILQRDDTALRNMIVRCCRAKARVVEEDETDQGLRMILNLGHTFGHALESLAGYTSLKHGEAVAIGCCLAAELSCRLQMLDAASADRIKSLFRSYSLPTQLPPVDPWELFRRFFHDKKTNAGRLRFILMNGIGDIVIRDDVSDELLLQLLQDQGGR